MFTLERKNGHEGSQLGYTLFNFNSALEIKKDVFGNRAVFFFKLKKSSVSIIVIIVLKENGNDSI